MIALVKMRELETDGNYSLRGSTLQRAIEVYNTFTFLNFRVPFEL